MRKIKFKLYDTEAGAMFPPFTLSEIISASYTSRAVFDNHNNRICFDDLTAGVNHGTVKALQYTGLKDEKGQEIYEGDIIEYDTEDGIFRVVVRFASSDDDFSGVGELNNILSAFIEDNPLCVSEPHDGDGIYTVVGNIYENPELITAKSPQLESEVE